MDEGYSGFRSGYRYIFSLPRGKMLALLATALNLLCAVISLPLGAASSFAKGAAAAALLVLASKLVEPRVITWKRAAGFYALFSLAAIPALAATGEAFYAVLFMDLLCFLFLAATSSPARASTLLILYTALAYFIAPQLFSKSLLSVTAYLAVSLAVLAVIDRRVKRSVDISGLKILRGFLRYILSGEREELEECFTRMSKERSLGLHVVNFLDTEGRVLGKLVVSEIHPGPMRDLGSSSLPSKVVNSCSAPTLFLKAPSTHSENLASSSEVERIAREVCSIPCGDSSSYAKVGAGTAGKFDVVVIDAGRIALAFIDPLVPMEDLPREVFETLREAGVIAVDTHSMIGEEYLLLDSAETYSHEISSLYESIRDALEKPIAEGPIRAGFHRVNYSDGRSVAPGGISCAVLEVGGLRLAVVSVDGNNMAADFKPVLLSRLKAIGVLPVVATTDSHLYTGAISGVDYYTVGSFDRELLLELCSKCVEEALSNARGAALCYACYTIKSRYLDASALKRLSLVTRSNVRDGVALALLALLTAVLTALL